MVPRLKDYYASDIMPKINKDFSISNPMLTPALNKIVVSVGVGSYFKDSKVTKNIQDIISLISSQKAVFTFAKISVAGFKIRKGSISGVKVTLRGDNMFIFLDKLISIAIPRLKDFRGLSKNGFDGSGNYSFGLDEQLAFPEVGYDDIVKTHGMNINIVTTANTDGLALKLLELFGFPFKR